MKRIVLLLGMLLVGAMLFACAPKAAPVEKPLTGTGQAVALSKPFSKFYRHSSFNQLHPLFWATC